ncbi:hypothetical protein IJS18_01980 [Candidatus Saccharibacteria bacterium]|nr:hypothetical protein [Candidatus Saccharibacteria bacterium]
MQPEEVMMQAYAKPKKEGNKFGLVIAMGIMLFIAAIAGVIFGVYEMMARNSEVEAAKAECAKSIEEAKGTGCTGTKEVPTISKTVAETLIDPYVMPLTFLQNIFNYDFDESMKATIAYKNLGVEDYKSIKDGKYQISYSVLNSEYKKLFGGTNTLGRTNFRVSNLEEIKYFDGEGSADYFEITVGGKGGAGLAMFDIVKSAEYDEDGNVVIVVYHDVVGFCGDKKEEKDEEEEAESEEKEDYCVDASGNSAIIRSEDEYNMKDLIKDYEKDIPQFKMKFIKHDYHLVLTSIAKMM